MQSQWRRAAARHAKPSGQTILLRPRHMSQCSWSKGHSCLASQSASRLDQLTATQSVGQSSKGPRKVAAT